MNHTFKAPRASRLLAALSVLVLLVTTLPVTASADDRWDNNSNYRARIQARIQAERLEAQRARLRAQALAAKKKHFFKRPPVHSNARFYRDNRYYSNYYTPNRWQQANASNYWRNVNNNRNWDGRW